MFTKFVADSSSRFPFRARTKKQTAILVWVVCMVESWSID